MSPSMKSSHLCIHFTICFCFVSISARANNGRPDLINVPLPVFKNSLEKTMEGVQNVTSTMSHMHVGDEDRNSKIPVSSYCRDLLSSTVEVLNWSLSTIHNLKANGAGDVVSHMRTWLNTSQATHTTCAKAFENGTNSMVAKSLKQVTKSIHALLGMVRVQQQYQHPMLLSAGTEFNGIKLSQPPDATVGQDGSGNFRQIMDAIAAAPDNSQQRFVILIKRGVYQEYINIDKAKMNLVLIGEGMDVTIISGDRSNASGWQTKDSATFAVQADGFIAMDIGFENTAGPTKLQAVAFSSSGDQSVFYRCKFSGYQDTLLVQYGRQFYRECTISGTIDFIFGFGTAVFQTCKILARMNSVRGNQNMITANGRLAEDSTGFSFHFCDIEPDANLAGDATIPSYLGRPWGRYSRTVFMKSRISDIIRPEGWLEWGAQTHFDTLYYAEYMNNGPGAPVGGRVKWPGYHVITEPSAADAFTVAKFIDGNSWLPSTGVPFAPGLEEI